MKIIKENVNDNEIKGFITNLGKYNEGELVGEWITFPIDEDELKKVFKRIGISDEPDEDGNYYEEYFFTDWETPDGIEFGEYENIDNVNEWAEKLENVDMDVVSAILECDGGDIDRAIDKYNDGDYIYFPDVVTDEDLAYAYIDEFNGDIKEAVGDNMSFYIDEDQMRREYSWDVDEIMRDTAEYEVKQEHKYDDEEDYDFDQEVEDWMDEHRDEYLDDIIEQEIAMAENGEIDLSNYLDYRKFGQDLRYDGFCITDNGAIQTY